MSSHRPTSTVVTRLSFRLLRLALSFAYLFARPEAVSANGAFADSKAILLSRTQPHRIVLSSDLSGLLVSEDDGASWSWICESAIGHYAGLFQLGPAPDEKLYAITQAGLAVSSDGGCAWQRGAKYAGDVFPDPNDPERVFAVVQTPIANDNPLLSDVVTESNDRGETFDTPRYATSRASITGVEVARSDSSAVYLTMSGLEQQHPYIVRSRDAGETWTEQDLSLQLERRPWVIRILMVHPVDASTLYIRLSDGTRDALAITHDGGVTLKVALQLETKMTAFLLRSDDALLVGTTDAASFISTDGGESFSPWSDALHFQALAERDGALYAVANAKLDGCAVATSTDGGSHWRPLVQLDELRGPLQCGSVPDQCNDSWAQLQPSLSVLSGKPRAAAPTPVADPLPAASSGCSVAATGGPNNAVTWLLAYAALSGGARRLRLSNRHANKETGT